MKNYERPIVVINDELAEGVYAASGSSDCWEISVVPEHYVDNPGYRNYRVVANHLGTGHISTETTITIPFTGGTVTNVKFEGFHCSVLNNVATLVRDDEATAEYSPDNFNSLMEVYGEAALTPIYEQITIVCSKKTSVNGHY